MQALYYLLIPVDFFYLIYLPKLLYFLTFYFFPRFCFFFFLYRASSFGWAGGVAMGLSRKNEKNRSKGHSEGNYAIAFPI